MLRLLEAIRRRWHPLYYLRKIPIFRKVTGLFDIPVWVALHGIKWKVRLKLFRNAGYILAPRSPEPEIAALFLAIEKLFKPSVFYDIGAHIGYYSLLLKSQNEDIEVVAFEPDSINNDQINRTIDRARITGISVLPYAVSDQEGRSSFAIDLLGGGSGTLENLNVTFNRNHFRIIPELIDVQTVTIDKIREDRTRISLIKIDVEGHEEKVFIGAERTISTDEPILIFESFDHSPNIIHNLQKKGYFLMDAERMISNLDQATNILALPVRYTSSVPELTEAWRQLYEIWMQI